MYVSFRRCPQKAICQNLDSTAVLIVCSNLPTRDVHTPCVAGVASESVCGAGLPQ